MENKELVKRIEGDIEKLINKNFNHLLMEKNDFALRTFMRLEVESLLKKYNLLAFKVVCDETNNIPFIVENNSFVIDIYLKEVNQQHFSCINVTVDCKSSVTSLDEEKS